MNKRWLVFISFLLLDIFAFVNCILYMKSNTGVFHTDNPVDLVYIYEAESPLTPAQLFSLNQYLLSKEGEVVSDYTVGPKGEVLLTASIRVSRVGEIPNPEAYNLRLSEVKTGGTSPRTVGVCALTGAGCLLIGGLILGSLANWAKEGRNQPPPPIVWSRRTPAQPVQPPVQYSYTPNVVNKIVIPPETSGLICIRQWITQDNCLYSTFMRTHKWGSKEEVADKPPSKLNENGVYAYKLGSRVPEWNGHLGIVELSGKTLGHKDGVIRGEKCTILTILVRNGSWAEKLSATYGIPVVLTSDIIFTFTDWLLNGEGLYWLQHNKNLLRELLNRPDNLTSQVNEILEKEKF